MCNSSTTTTGPFLMAFCGFASLCPTSVTSPSHLFNHYITDSFLVCSSWSPTLNVLGAKPSLKFPQCVPAKNKYDVKSLANTTFVHWEVIFHTGCAPQKRVVFSRMRALSFRNKFNLFGEITFWARNLIFPPSVFHVFVEYRQTQNKHIPKPLNGLKTHSHRSLQECGLCSPKNSFGQKVLEKKQTSSVTTKIKETGSKTMS